MTQAENFTRNQKAKWRILKSRRRAIIRVRNRNEMEIIEKQRRRRNKKMRMSRRRKDQT